MDLKWLLQISGALTVAAAGAIAVFFLWASSGVYSSDQYTEIQSFDRVNTDDVDANADSADVGDANADGADGNSIDANADNTDSANTGSTNFGDPNFGGTDADGTNFGNSNTGGTDTGSTSAGSTSADATDVEGANADELPANSVASVATDDTLTVVTYNIGYLSGLTNNQAVQRDRTLFDTNQQTAIAALDAADADFMAFQEIDFDAKRSFYVDQVAAIAEALGFPQGAIAINWNKRYVPFPYWPPAAHFGQIVSGQAVLSRYPITTNERVVLQRVASKPFYYNALYLDRLAQVTQVDVDGQPLVLINVHLEAFDEPTRRQQTATVLDLYNQYAADYPVILLGDFNSSIPNSEETDPTINQLLQAEGLVTAIPAADSTNQLTFPSDTPTLQLDYIFYDPAEIESISASVITDAAQASDHLPVQMEFRLRN